MDPEQKIAPTLKTETVDFPTAIKALLEGHTIRLKNKLDRRPVIPGYDYFCFSKEDMRATDWVIE